MSKTYARILAPHLRELVSLDSQGNRTIDLNLAERLLKEGLDPGMRIDLLEAEKEVTELWNAAYDMIEAAYNQATDYILPTDKEGFLAECRRLDALAEVLGAQYPGESYESAGRKTIAAADERGPLDP